MLPSLKHLVLPFTNLFVEKMPLSIKTSALLDRAGLRKPMMDPVVNNPSSSMTLSCLANAILSNSNLCAE